MWRRVLRGVKGFNMKVGVCAHSPASRVQHAQACLFVWKGGSVLGGAWQTQRTLFFCTCVRHFPVAADVEGVQPPARGERTKEQRATAPLTCSVGSACPTPRLQKNSKGNAVSRGRTRACDLGAADGERTQQAAAVATRWRISARITQSGGPWKVAYGNTCGRRQIADVKGRAGNKGGGHGRTCCFFCFLLNVSAHSHVRVFFQRIIRRKHLQSLLQQKNTPHIAVIGQCPRSACIQEIRACHAQCLEGRTLRIRSTILRGMRGKTTALYRQTIPHVPKPTA
jgi:hypothetical protein